MEESINKKFEDIIDKFNEELEISKIDPFEYSSLSLALIGDAVYDLIIRYYIMSEKDREVNYLHKKKADIVKAKSQAMSIDAISEKLSEKEILIYKRGRNSKSNTVPKNASINDYRKSTGFEALIGYLFLSGDIQRIIEIVKMALGVLNG